MSLWYSACVLCGALGGGGGGAAEACALLPNAGPVSEADAGAAAVGLGSELRPAALGVGWELWVGLGSAALAEGGVAAVAGTSATSPAASLAVAAAGL